ncbi:MAG: TIGR02679 family protein [Actinobacteria bacterium]|nr:TIGR02679 family protein [Actinomycetota bacterium]
MTTDRERLAVLLGGDDLAWLRARVRQRAELGAAVAGTVRLTDPSPTQRAAADRLMGRRPSTGAQVSVSLDVVERMLRDARICDGLATAVAALDGPIQDRRARHLAQEAAWAQVFADATAGADTPDARGERDTADPHAGGEAPWAHDWLDELAATGLLRRLAAGPADGATLLAQARAVLAALPAEGATTAGLAARLLGDSHALDDGQPVATLVLKGVLHRDGRGGHDSGLPTGERRRALWASVGVAGDELSSTVLALGLHSGPGAAEGAATLTDVTLRAHALAAEPVRLTLSQLTRHPAGFAGLAGTTVFVCENPAIVAAAARRLGTSCAPLVCVEGQPSAAAQRLLRQLVDAGARLLYHGDFDWPGLRIAQFVIDRFGAVPWRLTTADYRAAPAGPPLRGRPATTPWDSVLRTAMADRGVAVHEEQVVDDLLADLARAAVGS